MSPEVEGTTWYPYFANPWRFDNIPAGVNRAGSQSALVEASIAVPGYRQLDASHDRSMEVCWYILVFIISSHLPPSHTDRSTPINRTYLRLSASVPP